MLAGHSLNPERTATAAFFDVDNTLIRGSTIELRFFWHLFGRRQIGLRELAGSLWRLFRQVPPLSLQPLRERKLYLEGKAPSTIETMATTFVLERICPCISRIARETIERHRGAGRHLVLITASPDFLIRPLAGHLKIETVLAAQPERHGDRYTGRLSPPLPYGSGKRTLIERFATQHQVDLRYSYAYGDSPGDAELLRGVGYPVVVNPIRGMRRIAQREGWPTETW